MENLVIDRDFWRGRKVFLTGHTGFKGSWLSLWLQELGADVAGYALAPPTDPSLFDLAGVSERMTSEIADVRDLDRLTTVLSAHRPEIVVHMAAKPLVRQSYHDPVETYSVNVMGTVNLLAAIRGMSGVRVGLIITSDKCYENREWDWGYRESDRLGGRDPYSNSKACAELVTAAFRNSFFPPAEHMRHGLALASARAGNVIGGCDWAADRLIPDMMRAFARAQPALIRNPAAIRPWQHVLEPLSAYLLLCQKLWEEPVPYAGAWNFGPRDEDTIEVAHVADRICRLWDDGATWRCDEGEHPHEARYLKLDCSKARARLGWQPRWDIDEVLEATVSLYRTRLAGADVKAAALAQIRDYTGAHT